MKYNKESISYLFYNIKNGDFLGFYARLWRYIFARLIYFVTGGKLSHIAGVFDVIRTGESIGETVRFKLGEQSVSTGKDINEYHITYLGGDEYATSDRLKEKNIDLYLLPNAYELTKNQNETLKKYWSEKEDYSLTELPFTINWFHNLFGRKSKIYDNNCSTAARQSMVEIGITDSKFDDKVPNPTEFAKFNYIKNIVKIIKK